ncbi:MAG: RNA pseudouridine synthase [Clostridia bacterium]|nr:RNA pseudouridine synthase [Clostridia bacterium]
MKILYKSRDTIAALKPPGVPSQPDPTGDGDMLTLLSEHMRALGEHRELYLVHRLDRAVGGVMIFARNKKSAASLSGQAAEHTLTKKYYAVVEGLAEEKAYLKDYLYKDSAKGKAFVVDRARAGVKEATLSYERVGAVETERGTLSLLLVTLMSGRFHQIRAQLSSRGLSIVGDGKYGSRDKRTRCALFCHSMTFSERGDVRCVSALPDLTAYPWSLFAEKFEGREELI